MSELKFRAWAYYGEMIPNIPNHIANSEWTFGNMLNSDKFAIMQYTGLKDINGVEIYEGDIIELSEGVFSTVCFNDKTAAFAFNIIGDEYPYSDHLYVASYYSVIGNIHQNPELLSSTTGKGE